MECINLKRQFGDRYRVAHEESRRGRLIDPWLMIIPCGHGHICPWGGSNLAACTDRPGQIVGRLKRLDFTTVVQDGDDGANITFDAEYFEVVAEIMRPRKRARKTRLAIR